MKLILITDPHSRCFSTTLSTLISGNPHPIKFPSSFPLKKVSYSFPLTICLSKSLSTVDSQTHNQPPHGQIKSTEEIESLHVEVGSPKILPSLLLSTKFSLTDQAFFLLAFIACTTSVAFTSLVVAAVPTLFQESSKLENVSLLREPEDEPDVLIECRNVYKSFGDKHILRGVSFKIRHGEAVGIIGPSGTGKSTILKIMAGLLAPDRGEVLIRGKLRNGLVSDDEISGLRIGLVFQSAALFDSLTVRENVGFLLYENSTMPEDQIAQLVTETLAAVGLKEVEDRLPSELSGGMKKRVALARSIIFDTTKDTVEPEVLLYDEPTAGLDPIASTVVEDLIRSVHMTGEDALGKPGKIASYVVVTHQHSTIKRAVDRLLFLYEGKVVWQGMTREFSTSTNPIVRQFASGSLDGPIKY